MNDRIRTLTAVGLTAVLVFLGAFLGAAPVRCPVAGELVTAKVEIFYDNDWHDITADVRTTTPISITRGMMSEATGNVAEPGSMTLLLNNGHSQVQPGVVGRYSPKNPRSDLYGKIGRNTPIRVSAAVGDQPLVTRAVMEVVQWPPRWDVSEADRWVAVEAAGILRRLGVPGRPFFSALHRATVLEDSVVAYLPLEDLPQDPDVIPAGVGSPGRLRETGSAIARPWQWSADNLLPGSGALPVLTSEWGVTNIIEAPVEGIDGTQPFSLQFWSRTEVPGKSDTNGMFTQATLRLFVNDPSDNIGEFTLNLLAFPPGADPDVVNGGPREAWVVATVTDPSGSILQQVRVEDLPYTNRWRHVFATFAQSGSNVAVTLYLDGVQVGSGTFTNVSLHPAKAMQAGLFTQDFLIDQVGNISVGHLTVSTAASTTALTAAMSRLGAAGRGHVGETAGNRVVRLCNEEGINLTTIGDLDSCTPMGVQRPLRLLELLSECATAEAAGARLPIITETRDQVGLTFRTRNSFYITS